MRYSAYTRYPLATARPTCPVSPPRTILPRMTQPHRPRTDDIAHSPYIPASETPAELTPGVIVLGVILGLMFAASSVYLALKVSLTVSASIPVAVLSITIFRYISRMLGRPPATILQNNMVQTTGSAGESIAAGISFTLPALLLLGYNLPWTTVMAIGIVGGVLGVIFMIPLRRSLIVKEHANLKYPEGTACAQVLIVGEQRGVQAKTVFMGFGVGAAYKFLASGLHLWLEVPRRAFERAIAGGRTQLFGEIQAEISPELTGVGYIIGPRIAGYLFGGGVLSWFALIPAIKFFGAGLHDADLSREQAHRRHVGERHPLQLHLLHRRRRGHRGRTHQPRPHTCPPSGRRSSPASRTFAARASGDDTRRTERDMPMSVVVDRRAALRRRDGRPSADPHQRRRRHPRAVLRLPVRHRVEPHHGADRLVVESRLRHDRGDAAAHVAALSRGRAGSASSTACWR